MRNAPLSPLALLAFATLGLAACGDKAPPADAGAVADAPAAEAAVDADDEFDADFEEDAEEAAAPTVTLADGPDVCFRTIAEHLGADAKVSEILSRFTVEDGAMTQCTVDYQNPDDERKLVGILWDRRTGTFSQPHDIEISVSGNAADFRLDEYLIPLSQVDAASLTVAQESLKSELEGVYGTYSWTGVRLVAPGGSNNEHTLRLDLEGRIAANDVKKTGYASVSVDGKKVIRNHLMP